MYKYVILIEVKKFDLDRRTCKMAEKEKMEIVLSRIRLSFPFRSGGNRIFFAFWNFSNQLSA